MRVFLTVFVLVFSATTIAGDVKTEGESNWLTEWQQERSEGEIRSQCRQHVSKIKQCKFNAIVDESAHSLSSVILDVENFKEWALSVNVSDRVNFEDEEGDDIFVYTTYQFVGANNRDALSRYTLERDEQNNSVKIKFITVDKEIEKRDLRLVRFPLMAGYWQFTQLGNGKTEIEHLSFTLPGGLVQKVMYPLYNIAYLDSSFDTIRALQKQAHKPQYKNKQNEPATLVSLNELKH